MYHYSMRTVVAGSSGFVGSALIRQLRNSGHEVVGISRNDVDLRNKHETTKIIAELKPSILIDAAAKVGGIAANISFPVEFLIDNLAIQSNLLEAAHRAEVQKFVFLGSSCIYPRDAEQPIKEEYLMSGPLEKTNSAYAVAKIAGIELLNSYRREYGRKWIALLPTNLYGPKDNFNLETSHVLPALIRKFVEAQAAGATSLTLWGTGKPRREFLHVDDLAAAVEVVVEKYDSDLHINVGTGTDVTIREIASLIAEMTEYKGEIFWDSSKPDGTPRKVLDVTRIQKLGWTSKIALSDGVQSTIDWYKKNSENGTVRK
jgi:GDP-L-fucose synthase